MLPESLPCQNARNCRIAANCITDRQRCGEVTLLTIDMNRILLTCDRGVIPGTVSKTPVPPGGAADRGIRELDGKRSSS